MYKRQKEIDAQKRTQEAIEKSLQELLDDEKRAELKKRELENAILSTEDYQRVHKKAEDLDNVKAEIQEMKIKQNAANSDMTGCYVPNHRCIDNCIHSFSGIQLRMEYAEMMRMQGHEEETGKAKITKAYNLPCRYILHTVGPIISGTPTKTDCELLAGCYRSCLELAAENGLEEYWAWWSRHIYYNRYVDAPNPVYPNLYEVVKDKDYFVLTKNVDHQFQRAGFDKKRLFYTQGDYGLWQCSRPCHQKMYDNEDAVQKMLSEQKDMKIPTELIPKCPVCGAPMTMNLRCDDTFVQDEGWYAASGRYDDFIRRHKESRILFLELGVGGNTSVIIKYPFWQMTAANPKAVYACINYGEAV